MSKPNASIFDRDEERETLRRKLASRRSFLLHGPAGAGKTLLLKSLVPEFPDTLYCAECSTPQLMFRGMASALAQLGQPDAPRAFTRITSGSPLSAGALKGIVIEALRKYSHIAVLDHLVRPSQSFAAAVRELTGWANTPVVAVTHSAHMEDVGFLLPLFADKSEKLELRNFDEQTATAFANHCAKEAELSAGNLQEFLARAVELSHGNPGAIEHMVSMAHNAKYRSNGHIKITPLYIDFRLEWNASSIRLGPHLR